MDTLKTCVSQYLVKILQRITNRINPYQFGQVIQNCGIIGIYHRVMTNIPMENPLYIEVSGWENHLQMGHFPVRYVK